MPNIRIKDIPTTASATSSTDFIGIDGSANGTRKLNAYSPTFGGNLTVSGGSIGVGGAVGSYLDILQGGNDAYLYNRRAGPLIFGTNNTTALTLSSAQNATLAGNLTVSGTGTSSVAGGLSVGSGTGSGGQNGITFPKIGGGSYGNAFYLYSGNTNDPAVFGFSLYDLTNSALRWTTTNSGNFLLGTSTDGGQKLQVSGTAAISSTLTVGSGTSTFGVGGTTNQSTLVLNGGSSNGYGSRLELQRNGSAQSYIGTAGNILGSGDGAQSDTVIYANGSNKVRLYSGNALTLTLDSSQVATFASDVKISASTGTYYGGTSTGGGGFANNNASAYMLAYGSSNATYPSQLQFNSGGAVALRIDGSQNATFAGSIAINNTVQTAAAVVSTHKVTISIGGVTYYLLATNV